MQKILEVKGLSKKFGDHLVLDNLNFDIEEGSIVGVIGRSGCGKTTLLNTLVGFLKADAGKLFYKGKEISKSNSGLRNNIGFAVQESSLYNKLNVVENLNYFGKLYGLSNHDIKERTEILLRTFGLTEARHVLGGNLSVGMQKRLDIACALIHDPEILLLDEPTANLDHMLRKNIVELIKQVNDSGTTVIISSHHLEDIRNICHKVLIINNRKAVAFDTPENLELNFSSHKLIKLESELKNYAQLVSTLTNTGLVRKHYMQENKLMLFTKDIKSTLKLINQHYSQSNDNLINIDIIKPSLDTIFEHISRKP
ncbi:ABC transporter ATP-binding protein [Candidatus Woesearchaeota archaeon]|nr:ABC transporter ATP-binding protein [Candidatus Woesearchaeota archaeon]